MVLPNFNFSTQQGSPYKFCYPPLALSIKCDNRPWSSDYRFWIGRFSVTNNCFDQQKIWVRFFWSKFFSLNTSFYQNFNETYYLFLTKTLYWTGWQITLLIMNFGVRGYLFYSASSKRYSTRPRPFRYHLPCLNKTFNCLPSHLWTAWLLPFWSF